MGTTRPTTAATLGAEPAVVWFTYAWRVLLMSPVLIVVALIVGARSIAEIRLLDLFFVSVLSSIAGHTIASLETPFAPAVLAMLMFAGIYWLISRYAMNNLSFRRVTGSGPHVIISGGRFDLEEMRRARVNFDDLLALLRQKDIFDPADVDTGVLETSGRFSVLRKTDRANRSHAVVVDGTVDDRELKEVGRTRSWLTDELGKRRLTLADVLLASYSRQGELYIRRPGRLSGRRSDPGSVRDRSGERDS